LELSLKIFDISKNARAEEYFSRELAAGNSLSKLVCTEVDLSRGRLFVGLPNSVDPATLEDFEWGGLRVGPISYKELLARIAIAFITDPGRVVLIQDMFSTKRDLLDTDYRYRKYSITYREEVYMLLANPDIPEDDLMSVMACGSPYPYSVFYGAAGSWVETFDISDKELNDLVNGLTGIAVGAFDDASFLMWWSADSPIPFRIEAN
jgi:hypothetical protein